MVSINKMEKKRPGAEAPSGATGIPQAVQAKFEAASGLSFEDVRVHYNSSRPSRLGAYAYTQGNQVYIGPGRERHLEHELGHVVQQKRGLVRAEGYLNGLPVNRDPKLEHAADAGADQPVQGGFQFGAGAVQMMLGGRGNGPAVEVPEVMPPEVRQPEAAAGAGGAVAPRDLFAFGNAGAPRAPRWDQDFGIASADEEVGPETPPLPKGASTFGDVGTVSLSGHYHKISEGTVMPTGLGVIADGRDVNACSPHGETHHTIYPNTRMSFSQFSRSFLGLGWTHAGNKRQTENAGGRGRRGRRGRRGGRGGRGE